MREREQTKQDLLSIEITLETGGGIMVGFFFLQFQGLWSPVVQHVL